MARARRRQKEIVFRTHGGKRRGAGRKPVGERALVSHAARGDVSSRAPVLVTLKVKKRVWNLRTKRAFARLLPAFLAVCERFGMRLVHYSVQGDHIHLVVEAEDRRALARGMQSLCVRIARALNELMQTSGGVFADRYHHRVLATPRQVRAALAYVLGHGRRHDHAPRESGWLDPFSSALAFDGWRGGLDARQSALARAHPPPVARARSWLLAIGWKRAGGLLDPEHRPGPITG
ncbi:MAG: transposase [Myxococcota bacterium]|nr:transposase [Myxococcota bacterium]